MTSYRATDDEWTSGAAPLPASHLLYLRGMEPEPRLEEVEF